MSFMSFVNFSQFNLDFHEFRNCLMLIFMNSFLLKKNNSHLLRATAVFYLMHYFNYAIFLFTATAAAPASRIPMQKIRLIPALTSSVFGEVTAVTSSSATM